MKKESKNTF